MYNLHRVVLQIQAEMVSQAWVYEWVFVSLNSINQIRDKFRADVGCEYVLNAFVNHHLRPIKNTSAYTYSLIAWIQLL